MQSNMTVQCPQCGQQSTVAVTSLIDARQNPEAKNNLLSGNLNTVQCPNCGTAFTVAVPLVYHDADKELLITYVPAELMMQKDQQEKAIGSLMRQLTGQLPKDAIKGYFFRPREALTLQNLIEQILEADGITPEMMQAQRDRVRLVDTLMQAAPEARQKMIAEHDAEIDAGFFQALAAVGQRALQEGRPDVAQRLVELQEAALEHSTFGQQLQEQGRVQDAVMQSVTADISTLGPNAQRNDLIDLAVRYKDDDQKLQALVGLVRPALDYTFFEELTLRVGKAPAAERKALEDLRTRLVELTTMVDQQSQMALQNAVGFLRSVLGSNEPEALIRANPDQINDAFMAVLSANIEQAEQNGDLNASARLKQIYQAVVSVLQDSMPPALRFVNDLLSTESDEQAHAMLVERVGGFGDDLLETMDAVASMLAEQGEVELVQRIAFLREAAVRQMQA